VDAMEDYSRKKYKKKEGYRFLNKQEQISEILKGATLHVIEPPSCLIEKYILIRRSSNKEEKKRKVKHTHKQEKERKKGKKGKSLQGYEEKKLGMT